MLIGRKEEKNELRDALAKDEAQFIAVYGRRRVGKTFLIREAYGNDFCFQFTGAAHTSTKKQLARFRLELKAQGLTDVMPVISSWMYAFSELRRFIELQPKGKKVIFLDELPWMDAPRSDFLSEFEVFWNGWASAQRDIVLVVCGSSTSWMVKKIFKNKGGLYNRLTRRIYLRPFTLGECEELVHSQGIVMSHQQILDGYMIFGGIPFYWSLLRPGRSLAQEVDRLIFSDMGAMHDEFDMLYASLFNHPDSYIRIINILAGKKNGMTREEIIQEGKFKNNGRFSDMLNDLEWCGFIRSYYLPGKNVKDRVWQLMDNYTIFYFSFQKDKHQPADFWETVQGTPLYNTWCGLAFERVCMQHVDQIKLKLGISGVLTYQYAWRYQGDKTLGLKGVQIDLLIDRNDGIIDLCEMKYSKEEYAITEAYSREMARKASTFSQVSKTHKAVHTVMVTTYGLVPNAYAYDVQNQIVMDDLFA